MPGTARRAALPCGPRASLPGRPHGRPRAALPNAGSVLVAAFLGLLPFGAKAEGTTQGEVACVLRVGTSGDYAPFSVRAASPTTDAGGTQDGPGSPRWSGFDIELAEAFARDRGCSVDFVRFRWPDLLGDLAAGRFDVAMSGVTMRPERAVAGRQSVPVAVTHAVALAWKGAGASTLAELDQPGRRIGVNAGGHLEKVARRTFREAEVVAIPDNEAVRMGLLDRAWDAVVTDDLEAASWKGEDKGIVSIGPLSEDLKACLVAKDRDDLAAELDRWLLARERDGFLASMRRRHLAAGSAAAPPGALAGLLSRLASLLSTAPGPEATAEPLAALVATIVERMDLMPLVFEAKRRERLPIEDSGRESDVLDEAVQAVDAAASAVGAKATRADDVRAFFRVLMDMGKASQRRQAEALEARRLALVREKVERARAARAAGASGEDPRPEDAAPVDVTGDAPDGDGGERLERREVPEPRYDLATELRPAIGRLTAKLARILVALGGGMDEALVRSRLAAALAGHEPDPASLDELASAIVRLSSTR